MGQETQQILNSKMSRLITFRKGAALLLLLCFFLPLSKCTSSVKDGTITPDYKFPFENVTESFNDIRAGGISSFDGIPLLLITLIVFFGPVGILKCSEIAQSVSLVVVALPIEWLLYNWTTIGQPQIGGVLAMTCWAILFFTSIAVLWARARYGRQPGRL